MTPSALGTRSIKRMGLSFAVFLFLFMPSHEAPMQEEFNRMAGMVSDLGYEILSEPQPYTNVHLSPNQQWVSQAGIPSPDGWLVAPLFRNGVPVATWPQWAEFMQRNLRFHPADPPLPTYPPMWMSGDGSLHHHGHSLDIPGHHLIPQTAPAEKFRMGTTSQSRVSSATCVGSVALGYKSRTTC